MAKSSQAIRLHLFEGEEYLRVEMPWHVGSFDRQQMRSLRAISGVSEIDARNSSLDVSLNTSRFSYDRVVASLVSRLLLIKEANNSPRVAIRSEDTSVYGRRQLERILSMMRTYGAQDPQATSSKLNAPRRTKAPQRASA